MKITFDDQYLITVGEDASILLWKIQDKEGRGLKRDKEVGWAEEILITKSDLEEKVSCSFRLPPLCVVCQSVSSLVKSVNEWQLMSVGLQASRGLHGCLFTSLVKSVMEHQSVN